MRLDFLVYMILFADHKPKTRPSICFYNMWFSLLNTRIIFIVIIINLLCFGFEIVYNVQAVQNY